MNVDDCWALRERDATGAVVPDPARFPSGIPALAEYVHSKGMLLGWYSAMGTGTCEGFPGLNCTSAGDPCDQARRDVSRTTIAGTFRPGLCFTPLRRFDADSSEDVACRWSRSSAGAWTA